MGGLCKSMELALESLLPLRPMLNLSEEQDTQALRTMSDLLFNIMYITSLYRKVILVNGHFRVRHIIIKIVK